MALAALLGIALSQQPAINAAVGQVLQSPVVAAALSVTLSAVLLLALIFASGTPVRFGNVSALPWWWVIAGLIGAVFVAGSTLLVPITGAALFFVCLIAGQLVGALIIDAVGAFGMDARAISLRKLAGVSLAFAGVALVRLG